MATCVYNKVFLTCNIICVIFHSNVATLTFTVYEIIGICVAQKSLYETMSNSYKVNNINYYMSIKYFKHDIT